MKMLGEKDYNFRSTAEHEIIRNLKETHCYVALDYDEELEKAEESSSLDKTFELPDGTAITVNSERFRAPEVLFYPQLIGMESSGIHQVLFDSITRSPIDVRKVLYHNTVLTGVCLDVGDGATNVVPMYDGQCKCVLLVKLCDLQW